MKAIVFSQHGDTSVLHEAELPCPEPGDREVLVAVKACALNHLDLWVRQGLPTKIPMPHIGGCEAVGVVERVGSGVARFRAGDHVLIAPGQSCRRCGSCLAGDDSLCRDYRIFGYQTQGGFAEYAVADADDCIPVGPEWSFAEWAAVPLTFQTAWHMLFHHGRLRPGMDVLVHAAGSGVGTAAIQVAKHAGARVIATAGSAEKLQHATELGADYTVCYSANDAWPDEVLDRTGGRGVDLVIEHVGAALWKGSLKTLARGGKLITCGATSGPQVALDLRFFFTRQIAVVGSYMGNRSELLDVLKLVARRELRPAVHRCYPLAELAAAQDRMAARRQFGKIVVSL